MRPVDRVDLLEIRCALRGAVRLAVADDAFGGEGPTPSSFISSAFDASLMFRTAET